MISLDDFNQRDSGDATAVLLTCAAIPDWAHALVQARPYASLDALMNAAREQVQGWDETRLAQALRAHPRIGEKPAGGEAHAALSRQEQAAVNDEDATVVARLREGNIRYEARFGRVFLVRARGRSAADILQILEQRLQNSPAQEVQAALVQLREITLLRLEGAIGE